MKNPWSQLDCSFINKLSPSEIDDAFIAAILSDDEDFMTVYDVHLAVFSYPGLDTVEKVYDKAYTLIEKMLHHKLLLCKTLENNDVTFEQLNKHKEMIYRVMEDRCTGKEAYKYLFYITDKGKDFLQTHLPTYQPILDELCNLTEKDIKQREEEN